MVTPAERMTSLEANTGPSGARAWTLRAAPALCLAGALVGAIGLIGWFTNTPLLATWIPGLPPTRPNTALALALLGASGALGSRPGATPAHKTLSLMGAVFVLALEIATLADYEGLHLRVVAPILHAGRSTPPTALALSLL